MSEKKLAPAILDGLAGALFIAWFFFPVAAGAIGTPTRTFFIPYSMPFAYAREVPGTLGGLFLYGCWLVPAFGLFRIICSFLGDRLGFFGKPNGVFAYLGRILSTGIAVYAFLVPFLHFADSLKYFSGFPITAYVSAGLGAVSNVFAVFLFLKSLNLRNPFNREYRTFKKSIKNTKVEGRSAFETLFRIRTKLFVAFIGIITFTLAVLSGILLNNYYGTILKAVGDGAKNQVEQASTNYRVNLGDSIAMIQYVAKQKEINSKSEFSFSSLSVYTDLKSDVYLDALPVKLPDYKAEYSTLGADQFPSGVKALPGAIALDFARAGGLSERHDSAARTFTYVSPIVKPETEKRGGERVRRERLLGFSVMTFDENVIMKPFFHSRNSVFVLTALFLYLAIVLTYIVGNLIVNPLLFLRMNVRKISDVLRSMIRGESRVSANTLIYDDPVKSRDEIKDLSLEFSDFSTVIRGIIPYISASTLKQAEKGTSSSTERELAFLFTDIRGFTTLCEGKQPDEVVGILNTYLDLETEIILKNHGDVDKFVGDEMMAFFDGPDKELNACKAAMQIRHAMMEEKERREKEGMPIVSVGIGINSGNVVFGSVGARERMDFTSIGDTVNLAARLEGQNKEYHSKSIITQAVYEKVKGHFLCRELDLIAVKGKTKAVRIYEILQETKMASPKLEEIKSLFEKGLAFYRKGNWNAAAEPFKKNVQLYKDGPSEVFYNRLVFLSRNPPEGKWDGIFRATEK
jgi:adenylate cyclase